MISLTSIEKEYEKENGHYPTKWVGGRNEWTDIQEQKHYISWLEFKLIECRNNHTSYIFNQLQNSIAKDIKGNEET